MAGKKKRNNRKNPHASGGGHRPGQGKGQRRHHHKKNPFLGLPVELTNVPALAGGAVLAGFAVPTVTDLFMKGRTGPLAWLADLGVTGGLSWLISRLGGKWVAIGFLAGGAGIVATGILEDVTGTTLALNRGAEGVRQTRRAPLPQGDEGGAPQLTDGGGNAKGMGWARARAA